MDKTKKFLYRLELDSLTEYTDTHVLSSVQKRNGRIYDCTITTVALSKSYWQCGNENTAIKLRDKLANIDRKFKVAKFLP